MPSLRAIRSALVGMMLAVFVCTLVAVELDAARWVGSWGETVASIQTASRLTWPLSGAVAATVSAYWRHRRATWILDTSARRPAVVHGSRVAALFGASAVGTTLAAIAPFVQTLSEATYGRLPVMAFVSAVATPILPITFGYVVGMWTSPSVAVPLSAATIYLTLVYFDPFSSQALLPLASFFTGDDRDRTFLMEFPVVALARTVWYVIAATCLLYVGLRNGRRAFELGVALALASAPLLFVGASNFHVDARSGVPVCEPLNRTNDQHVQLCLSAARDHERQEMVEALQPVATYLPSGYVLGDEGLQTFGRTKLDATISSTSGGSAAHVPNRNEVLAYFLATEFQQQPCPGSATDLNLGLPRDLAYFHLDTKLITAGQSGFFPTAPPPEALTWNGQNASFRQMWTTLSPDERDAYIRQNWRTLTGCRE